MSRLSIPKKRGNLARPIVQAMQVKSGTNRLGRQITIVRNVPRVLVPVHSRSPRKQPRTTKHSGESPLDNDSQDDYWFDDYNSDVLGSIPLQAGSGKVGCHPEFLHFYSIPLFPEPE